MTRIRERIFVTLIASLMVVSMFGAAVVPAPVSAADGPEGMVALGSGQISEDVPEGADLPIRASDLEGAVYASEHAGSLEVVLTTPERADEHLGPNASVVANDEVAIVLRDDEVHEGRDVAVSLDVLEQGLGFVPKVAYGTHESGEEWRSSIERQGTVGVFHVPEFSSNSVTFTGGITLDGDAAGDGTQYQYELDSLDGIDDFSINMTGVSNSETDTISGTTTSGTIDAHISGTENPPSTTLTLEGNGFGSRYIDRSYTGVGDGHSDSIPVEGSLSDTSSADNPTVTITGNTNTEWDNESGAANGGESSSVSLAGTLAPTGPSANGNPTLSVTHPGKTTSPYASSSSIPGNFESGSAMEYQVGTPPSTFDQVTFSIRYLSGTLNADIYVVGEQADGTYGEGTLVAQGKTLSEGQNTVSFDPVSMNADNLTIEVVHTSGSGTANFNVDGSYPGMFTLDGNTYGAAPASVGAAPPSSLSANIDDESVSFGNLANGETKTLEVTPSTSATSIDWSASGSNLFTWELDAKERTATTDPSVTLSGTTKTYTGTLSEGQTATLSYSPSVLESSGSSNGISLSLPSVSADAPPMTASYDVSINELDGAKDPSVDIDGDGAAEASYSGLLVDGQSQNYTISPTLSDDSWAVDSTGSPVTISADVQETTVTQDPGVIVNGYETTYNGTLAENETVSVATNEAWLREGTNNVTVTTNSPDGGPEGLVGFEYSHDAAGTTKSMDVETTSWTESFNVSHTFPSQVADAESTLTFNEHVVEIDRVEVRKNGGSWNKTNAYSLNGTDLTVQLGDVAADSEIDIRATGYKVGVQNGAIDVLEPTVDGDKLDTKIEIANRSEDFALDLSGMDRVHYAAEETWTGDSAYVTVDSGGDQHLHFADANEGSTARVRTIPLEVEPVDGEIAVHVENPEAPRFRFSDDGVAGSSSVDVTYHDTTTGNRYVLWSVTQNREIDADRAESPVEFSTGLTSAQTFEVRQRDRSDAVGGAVPAQQSPGSSAPLVLVVPAVGISVAGLFWAGRRFGGASGIRGNAVLLVGSTIVAVAALELVSPGTISSIWRATVFAIGDAAASGVGAVIAAFAVFVGVWQINAQTSADVPWWVTLPTVGIASVMALEAIRPGSVLGALQGVLAEVGGLVVLIVLGIVAYVIYTRRKTQQAEASTPDTQVTLDMGQEEN